MNPCARYGWRLVLPALILSSGLLAAQEAQTDDSDSASAATPTANNAAADFSQPELEQMLAPIALYPDALLAQILMAATYPLEVVEAARWSQANPNLGGDAAVAAVASQGWDASVKSLVAFPRILATMSDKLEWTEHLGDAFLSQQAQVMDAVQDLRRLAQVAGTLGDDAGKLDVEQNDGDIEIGGDDSGELYIPYCDPFIAYGAWPWAQYPPMSWAPWPDYYGADGCSWGAGIFVEPAVLFGSFAWPRHHLHDRRFHHPHGGPIVWRHDPIHRRGVAYRDPAMNRAHPRTAAAAAVSVSGAAGIPLPPSVVSGYTYAPGVMRAAPYRYGNGTGARMANEPSHSAFGGRSAVASHASPTMHASGGGGNSGGGGAHASSSASSGSSGSSHSH